MNKNIVLSLLLFLGGMLLAWLTIFAHERSFSPLTYTHQPDTIEIEHTSTHRTIEGSFTADDNYLGGLNLRLNVSNSLLFSKTNFYIKERGSDHWYYTNSTTLKQDSFQPLYPVGFPIIANSQGKEYIYRVRMAVDTRSIRGDVPLVLTDLSIKYQYPKSKLLANKLFFVGFIFKKLEVITLYNNQLLLVIFCLSPLFCYIIKKYSKVETVALSFLLLLLFLLSVFNSPEIGEVVYGVGLILWLYLSISERLDEHISIFFAMLFMFTTALVRAFGLVQQANSAATWTSVYVLAFVVLTIIKNLYNLKTRLSLSAYLRGIQKEILD